MAPRDLDAARAARREAKGEGPQVVFGGQVYQLVSELPLLFAEYANADRFSDAIGTLIAVPAVDEGGDPKKAHAALVAAFMANDPSLDDLNELALSLGSSAGEASASSAS